MANQFDSNFSRKLMKVFLKAFESSRVLTKTVNTQQLSGKINPSSGTNVDFKRPHDYKTHRTAGGDISDVTKSDIIAGKATGTVQNYFTAATEWSNLEEATTFNQMEAILAPMARRIVTDLEVDFADYMMKNSHLVQGTVGTSVASWLDVASAGALMASTGVPNDSPWYYVFNPFTQVTLADVQKGLSAGDSLVTTAWEKAQVSKPMAGLQALTGVSLSSYTSGAGADRAGTLSAAPDQTYVTHKDTMQQTLSVTGMDAVLPIVAGDVIEITQAAGEGILNQSTRTKALNASGARINFRAVVAQDVTLVAGAGDIVINGPAIFETGGQYNTISAALAGTEVVTVLGAASTSYQPNLFYHSEAFGLGTVKIPKLFSTDTVATTEDGFSLRVSKYSDGDANTQKIRFDLLPAYATFNPYFAGHGWG